MAADINVGETGLSPLLLFLNPGLNSNLFYSLSICKKSGITSRNLKHPFAGIFLTKDAKVVFPFAGALSDGTEWGTAILPTAGAGFVGIAEIGQELPEVVEARDFFAPKLVTLFDH